MRKVAVPVAVFLAFLVAPCFAQEPGQGLTVDLASDHVDITTGFNGTGLELFGVKPEGGDIAVVVSGPKRTMTVRRKERIFGAWVNKSAATFENVPSYYGYAVSESLDSPAAAEMLRANGIGPEHLRLDSEAEDAEMFRKALIRNEASLHLFSRSASDVRFIGPGFFRADFSMPPNVPVGLYEVKAFYFADGAVKDVKTKKLKVAHVGINAGVKHFAHDRPFLYGFTCVILAIFAGWVSNRLRRG